MIAPVEDAKINAYLRGLNAALSDLPEAERNEIVAEIRTHVLDRLDAGTSIEEVLKALGTPDAYAAAMRESRMIAAALSTKRTPLLIGALMHSAVRNTAGIFAIIVISMAWVLALMGVALTLLKVYDPTHVGIWLGPQHLYIGIMDDTTKGHEILGPWIAPVAILLLISAWAITRGLAVWTLRRWTKNKISPYAVGNNAA